MANPTGPQPDLEKTMEGHTRSVTNLSESNQQTDVEIRPGPGLEKDAQDPDLVDWDGPDDPENPFNWTTSKKTWQLVFMAFNTFLT